MARNADPVVSASVNASAPAPACSETALSSTDSVAVEVGIFGSNFTQYLLEEGLDMSYNSCFKRDVKSWHNVGLVMVETRPILMMTCGYGYRYRRQDLKRENKTDWDLKPEIDDVVKWI